jgi:hypothetical protein
MTEYRVTRPERYEEVEKTTGPDLSNREGYYKKANSAQDAAEKVAAFLRKAGQLLPGECRFDVQVWKRDGMSVRSSQAVRIKLMS